MFGDIDFMKAIRMDSPSVIPTTVGLLPAMWIHNGKEVEIYGSQGQHRTAILSLKLSELKVIYDEIGEYPILLLDDFMSELDDKRRKNFLNNIKDIQVIITCNEKLILENLKYFSYNVISGNVIEKN